MTTKVLVLGDGTGGVVVSNLLGREARRKSLGVEVTLIGHSPMHTYQPGCCSCPSASRATARWPTSSGRTPISSAPGSSTCSRRSPPSTPRRAPSPPTGAATATTGWCWRWAAAPWSTPSKACPSAGARAHGFYTPESALALAGALERFEGGDLLVDIADMPIKCPVAPLEFVCLVDDYLGQRGIRSRTKLRLMTPLSGAFTKPVCNDLLTGMLVAKGVHIVPNAPMATVTDKDVACPDGKTVPYDLLVTIPPHEGSALIDDAGLGDGLGFGLTDKHTLKAKKAERVFLLGDNTNAPTSKAGSVAHFQAEVVVHNLLCEMAGQAAEPLADGHANCFIETGHGKAILVDFNYDIQPVPGKFPLPGLGPMTLLGETRLNHLGKLALEPI